MAKGWDQPSKVELDAALRSMVREIGLVGDRAGMQTEEVDLELRFTLEIESDGEVRPVVHLGGELPASEVHTVRVSLRPQSDAQVAAEPRAADQAESEAQAPAQEPARAAASRPAGSEGADRQPAKAAAEPEARGQGGLHASPPPPTPPSSGTVAGPPAAPPRIRPGGGPRLRLRKASPEQPPSSPEPEPAYRSEVDVGVKQSPVVEERHLPVKMGAPPVVLDDARERRERAERKERVEKNPDLPEPADKTARPRPPPKPNPFLVFDSQRKRGPGASIEMLDTAEFSDDASDTMVTGIPPEGNEDTDTE